MNVKENTKFGGFFRKTHIRGGAVIDTQDSGNIVPNQGMIYLLEAAINAGTVISGWHIGVFMDNYTPLKTDIGDTFFTNNNEMQSYAGERPAWTTDTAVATVDPVGISVKTTSGSEASYTIDDTVGAGDKVYGAGIISEITKGGSADVGATVLLAATQFTNPGRDILENDIIKVEYIITGTST